MNKIHRIVWSAVRGAFIVAHELANSHGKPSTSRPATQLPSPLFGSGAGGEGQRTTLALAVCLAALAVSPAPTFAAPPAPPTNTLPTNGQIVGGASAGSIATTGNAMTVTQNQQKMIANWQSFSIGSAASVHFAQPTGGVALNRVNGGQPSEIFGKLSSTGAVYLLNSAGIIFGRGAQVDVGALVASTGKMTDADFLAGRLKIAQQGATGKILNEGELKAAMDGYIALLAPEVRNQGVIFAQKGTVALAAGEAYELQFDGTKLANVRVTPGDFSALVENGNAVEAPGGLIILSAHAVTRLQGAAIKNNGTLDASSMTMKGGRIVLEASDRIENTGSIKASGSANHAGGSIELTAPVVEQRGSVDVSGSTGGNILIQATERLRATGEIIARGLVGKGGEVLLKLSQSLNLDAGSRIDVSGATDGGRIDAEAGLSLKLAGTLSATGEAGSGGDITLASGGDATLADAKVDAGGTAQGGTVRIKAERSLNTALLDPANPLNDPTAPGTPTQVAITGSTTLSTRSSRGKGGQIDITGDDLLLGSGTRLDATGETGGGLIQVGGGWQGSGGLYQATTVTMEQGAVIDVSALKVGAGGTAVLWSDIHKDGGITTFAGEIRAEGADGGAGGQVETSGHTLKIADTANVTTGGGNWLLDPFDFTIGTDITSAALQTALETGAGQTVTISTQVTTGETAPAYYGTAGSSGDIIINDTLGWSKGTLTLKANHSVLVNKAVTVSGSGGLTVNTNLGGYADALGTVQALGTRAGYLKMKQNRSGQSGTDTFDGYITWTSSASPLLNNVTYTKVSTQAQLEAINGTGSAYFLANDIPLSGAWNPINFSGKLEGFGHIISNLSITNTNTNNPAGFIATANNGTVLQNIGLVNAQISTQSNKGTGAFIGRNWLNSTAETVTLRNLFVDTTSNITQGGTTTPDSVGGFVGNAWYGSNNGQSYGTLTIVDGYNGATIQGTGAKFNSNIGGILGNAGCGYDASLGNNLTLMNLTNIGVISGGTAANPKQGYNVGGIFATLDSLGIGGSFQLENLKNYGNISGDNTVGGIGGAITHRSSLTGTSTMTARLLTNYGDISSVGGYTGGIFGTANVQGDPIARTLTISGATNKGAVTSTSAGVGGIIGNSNGGKGNLLKLYDTVNEGTVGGYNYVGGLLGQLSYSWGG
jgi:filamentous hemagglutinin family protein